MGSWEFVVVGYGLTAVTLGLYAAGLYRRLARARRRRRSLTRSADV